ncbi:MAG: PKD domain-containing protein [Flavobacteriales bacterium]|nr:PKD domain-containing protein [Flavobacteriales bacterium]
MHWSSSISVLRNSSLSMLRKCSSAMPAPMIGTLASTGELMAFNKYGAITEGLSIPVKVQTGVAGTYTITAGISGNPFSCMWLEDTQTGTLTALTDGAQYSFQLEAGASTTARFLMHSTAAVPMVLEGGLCGANGSATVDLGNNTADITWTTPTGTVVLEQLGATGENTFSTNNAGNYTIHISTNAVCGEMVQDFYIDIDATDVVAAFDAPAEVLVNGTVELTNNSTADGAFFWNFGDNSTSTDVNPTHSYSEPGTYTVTLEVTADDCSVITTQEVVVSVNTGIATIASAGLNVWSNAQGIVMEHSFTEGTVKVEVLDATGRLHIQRQVPATPGRTVIATDALNTGIWFVRVTNGERVQSFRVPLVR